MSSKLKEVYKISSIKCNDKLFKSIDIPMKLSLSSQRRNLFGHFIKQKENRKYVAIIIILAILIITIITTSLLFQLDQLHDGNNQIESFKTTTEQLTTLKNQTINISSTVTTTTTPAAITITPTTTTTTTETPSKPINPDYVLTHINEQLRIIYTEELEKVNLKYLLEVVNSTHENKHFNELYINNQYIESIDQDILGEIRIDYFVIWNSPNLERIHWNAFGNQTQFIQIFYVWDLPKLISKPKTEYDLYELINKLVGCEHIQIIPFDNQLKSIKLSKLKRLNLRAYDYSIKIHSINHYAFYQCDSIENIDLRYNNISQINQN